MEPDLDIDFDVDDMDFYGSYGGNPVCPRECEDWEDTGSCRHLSRR